MLPERVRARRIGCEAREARMSKDKEAQGIARTGRGEQQPLDKDRAQRVSATDDGPASHGRREPDKSARDGKKKPSTSGHS
jgi:hypothetical protein